MLAMIEMVINGVSIRKIEQVTEELCGRSFSKSKVREDERVRSKGLLMAVGINEEGYNEESVIRLIGALLIEQDEGWSTGKKYFDMQEYYSVQTVQKSNARTAA